mmetsp:Transcript_3586/g.6547  ORF Transcript_3586/g.6547 Transcript_3586/m.6547 type:complete len:113 (-) Transcript_3586:386-724(-)
MKLVQLSFSSGQPVVSNNEIHDTIGTETQSKETDKLIIGLFEPRGIHSSLKGTTLILNLSCFQHLTQTQTERKHPPQPKRDTKKNTKENERNTRVSYLVYSIALCNTQRTSL